MGGTRAAKELYFEKFKALIAQYREFNGEGFDAGGRDGMKDIHHMRRAGMVWIGQLPRVG